MKLLRKKIIKGCDARGDGESPFLTRITLFACRFCAAYIHKFHRSDADEHHDHPWAFVSLILWRGYFEETSPYTEGMDKALDLTRCAYSRKRVWPGMVLFRKATHRHRVVLVGGKPAVTLIIRGPYVRDWGFFTRLGWQHWKDYFKERGCK